MPTKGAEQTYRITSKDKTERGNFTFFVASHKSADGLSKGEAGYTNLRDALACIKRWQAIEEMEV